MSDSDIKASPNKAKFLGLRGPNLHRAIGMVAGIGFILFGYDQGVMGSLLTLPDFLDTFPKIDAVNDASKSTLQGFVVAVYEIGCFAGALITMWKGDYFGRRKVIFYGGIIMTIGAILQCTSFSVEQLAIARVVTGVGNGFITSTIPTLQSECAKPAVRGKLVMMSGALITGGVMLSYWIDFGFYFTSGPIAWRFPLAFQMVFSLILVSLILFLPESPRWLIRRGQVQQARVVFSALDDLEVDSEEITHQVDEIITVLNEEADATSKGFMVIFRNDKKKNLHRTILAYMVQCFQQISGINLITYYAGTIFESYIGMNALNSRILAACNGTEYFLVSWIAFWTIEKFGRRSLFVFGTAGQAASMAILCGTGWGAQAGDGNSKSAIACAVFLFVFNTFFAIGMLGMTWLLPPELVSLEARAAATGLSTSSNWIFNFLVVMITPVCFAHIGPYTYAIFAVVNFLMVPVIYLLIPETKGRSLEEMDFIFEACDSSRPWSVVKVARDLPYEADGYDHIAHMRQLNHSDIEGSESLDYNDKPSVSHGNVLHSSNASEEDNFSDKPTTNHRH